MNPTNEILKEELGKFFVVADNFKEKNNKVAFMPSSILDNYWHQLLSSDQYNDFCIKTVGRVVKHNKNKGFGQIEWVKTYEAKYGKLPSSWFYLPNGEFDLTAYENYQKTGIWKAAWDCTPA